MMFRLVLSGGTGVVSKLIRFFIRSSCISHAAGAFKIYKADVLMESSERGVGFVPAKVFASKSKIEAVIAPVSGPFSTPAGIEHCVSWLIDNYGAAEYDYLAAGAIGVMNRLRGLWALIGSWLRRKLSKKKVHCTELWVLALQQAGYLAVEGLDPQLVDPLALAKALYSHPEEFSFIKLSDSLRTEIETRCE